MEKVYNKAKGFSLAFLGSSMILGGLYYLLNIDNQEDENEDKRDIRKKTKKSRFIKKLNSVNKRLLEFKSKNKLNNIEVSALISRNVEEELEEIEYYNRNQRIQFFTDKIQYEKLVVEIFKKRHEVYDKVINKFLILYSDKLDIDSNDASIKKQYLLRFTSSLTKDEIKRVENLMYTIYVPKFFGSIKQSKDMSNKSNDSNFEDSGKDEIQEESILERMEVVNAIEYYCDNTKTIFDDFKNNKNNIILNIESQRIAGMVLKTKADDMLYMKYGVNFSQLIFLTHLYGLNENEYVIDKLSSIGKN